MRLLLAQNAPLIHVRGGANKSNQLLMRALARRGHRCRMIGTADDSDNLEAVRAYLTTHGRPPVSVDRERLVIDDQGVEVYASGTIAHLRRTVASHVAEFEPDWVLVSSEDPGQLVLRAALQSAPGRVVYLARTTFALPFGPDAAMPVSTAAEAIRKTTAILAVSEFIREYIETWGGLESRVLPISLQDGPTAAAAVDGEPRFVAMINPCAYKGITIFLALARAFPDVPFAAVPTWGTTDDDLAALTALPNMTILPSTEDEDRLYARIRTLIVPSLWAEAKARVVLEAMLRGRPVLASNIGGLPEAKCGVPYLLPANPIPRYLPRFDGRRLPLAEVPEQPIGAWVEALGRVVSEPGHYDDLSRQSREAAQAFLERTRGVAAVEEFLITLSGNRVLESQGRA